MAPLRKARLDDTASLRNRYVPQDPGIDLGKYPFLKRRGEFRTDNGAFAPTPMGGDETLEGAVSYLKKGPKC